MIEDSGTLSREVEFYEIKRTHDWRRRLSGSFTDAEVQKHGEQTGLDTLVVHALTYEC